MTSRQLHGTVAVVTGGASGIGYSLAKAYGLRGASVVIIDRDRQGLNRALTNLARAGVDGTGHAIDLCDAAAVDAIASEVESAGPLSAVCLNAGVNGGGANVWETTQSAFDFVFGVNVWSLVNSIRSLVPLLETSIAVPGSCPGIDWPVSTVITPCGVFWLSLPVNT